LTIHHLKILLQGDPNGDREERAAHAFAQDGRSVGDRKNVVIDESSSTKTPILLIYLQLKVRDQGFL
jgi:hypothetical protein